MRRRVAEVHLVGNPSELRATIQADLVQAPRLVQVHSVHLARRPRLDQLLARQHSVRPVPLGLQVQHQQQDPHSVRVASERLVRGSISNLNRRVDDGLTSLTYQEEVQAVHLLARLQLHRNRRLARRQLLHQPLDRLAPQAPLPLGSPHRVLQHLANPAYPRHNHLSDKQQRLLVHLDSPQQVQALSDRLLLGNLLRRRRRALLVNPALSGQVVQAQHLLSLLSDLQLDLGPSLRLVKVPDRPLDNLAHRLQVCTL